MLPLALGAGPGAEERRTIAVVVIGGQTLSLLLTLIVTPVAYAMFDDLGLTLRLRLPSRRFGWLRGRFGGATAETQPIPSLPPTVPGGPPHPHLAERAEPQHD
jgi:hypothetical protein